jgi:predicted Zn-dependent protease
MQAYFYRLAEEAHTLTSADEVSLCDFSAEVSDFVRFNHARVRQAGSVTQRYLRLSLIRGKRQGSGRLSLSGDLESDRAALGRLAGQLRARLREMPEDPYLLYATQPQSSVRLGENRLPPAQDSLREILDTAAGLDFVGLYAAGAIYRGFANSLGQRNWHESYSFNLDWSLHHGGDKAVKAAYAGFDWDGAAFYHKLEQARTELEILKQPARSLQPGQYRAYLAPAALFELLAMLGNSGFSLKAWRTKQSSLLKMQDAGVCLNPLLSLSEHSAAGIGPDFQSAGFRKPPKVDLIEQGRLCAPLVSPRSAREYEVPGNAANDEETPESLEMAGGGLAAKDILSALEGGIYLNNLWYLNYSDRPACRITGMTRFAAFWVEQGKIIAPIEVMRFDDTLYRILGENLLDLTREREWLFDPGTYEQRSTACAHLPGALVRDFRFTL